jgi:hypothetical protein
MVEGENYRLSEQLQKLRNLLFLDENGSPMEPKQVILLREENQRLQNKISVLEQRLEEYEVHSPTVRVQVCIPLKKILKVEKLYWPFQASCWPTLR